MEESLKERAARRAAREAEREAEEREREAEVRRCDRSARPGTTDRSAPQRKRVHEVPDFKALQQREEDALRRTLCPALRPRRVRRPS